MAEKKININRNALYNMLKSAFGIIYPLITFPYISRVLMAENVGKINFGNSIISYFALLASLGISTYAIRECAKVRENKEDLNLVSSEILSISITATAISYILLLATLFIAKPLENYRLLIIIQSVSILFTTLGADWINAAMEDFKFIAVRTVLMQIVSLIFMFMFIHKPEDYLKYAIISVVATSGANIANVIYRRKYCKTKYIFKMNARKHLPPIMMMFSLTLSQIVYVNSDMTMLGLMHGDLQVGLYSTSVKIYGLVNTTIASIALVVMPQLSSAFERKDYVEVNKLLKYAVSFIAVLGIPCVCGIEIIAPQIIRFFAGDEYVGAALSLRILGLSLAFSLVGGWIGNASMIPAGREKICLKTSVISASVNIVLNLLLIPKWGLNAAAATTALSEFISVLVLRLQMDRSIRIEGVGNILKGPILGGIGIFVIGSLFKFVFTDAWVITLSTIVCSIIMYIGVLVITKNEFFLEFVKPLSNRIKGEEK